MAACATAVDQGFVEDDSTGNTGGSQSSPQGGSSSLAGHATGGVGGQPGGSAGKPAAGAFGGTSSTGSGGISSNAGSGNGGTTANSKAGAGGGGSSGAGAANGGNGGNATAGTGAGGAGQGGNGGAGGTTGSGGKAGSGGTAGTAGGGGSSGGTGGSPSSGDCAPANSGWVVQYWTSTPAANMPAGDLRIFNNAGGSVNFNTLELRHYFTNEETATLSFIFSTFGHNFPGAPYYEDEGGANVLSSIQNVTPAATNASQYISIKFNGTPGNFGNGESTQLGFYGNLSMYPLRSNQANDYTYIGHATSDPGSANKTTGWDRITLYVGGKLVWGCEP
ncbi:MAG TPA: hypothetical protein VHP33_05610 [Polyangiaceae bacterium]|nr:hypothetical protein [Polyangiaceae bacterium]